MNRQRITQLEKLLPKIGSAVHYEGTAEGLKKYKDLLVLDSSFLKMKRAINIRAAIAQLMLPD